jgi:hypothetical protein
VKKEIKPKEIVNEPPKKISLEHLLEKKLGVDSSKNKEYFSEVLGGNIDLIRINPQKVADLIAAMNGGELTQYETYQQLVYFSCPLFQNKELLEKFDIVEPCEIVYKVLNLAEVFDIGNQLIQWYGFNIGLKK